MPKTKLSWVRTERSPLIAPSCAASSIAARGGRSHALANSLLVEYVNSFDLWYADPVPAGDGGPMAEPGGMITDVDGERCIQLRTQLCIQLRAR